MVKTALRGQGTRGGGSTSGGKGRGGGDGRGNDPGQGGSGRGISGGGDGGRGAAPEYIPLGELAAMAAARTSKARGKHPVATSEPVLCPAATSEPVLHLIPARPTLNLGASLAACEGATNAGGSPVAQPTSNVGSSNSSNPSPPSQGTRVSHSNFSAARTIPLQYPPSTNPQGGPTNVSPSLNLNMRLVGGGIQRDVEADEEEEEEEDRDDEEELEDDVVENDELGAGFEAVAEQQPHGLDDEQLLANLLALPGRQRLPLLSEVVVPDSLW